MSADIIPFPDRREALALQSAAVNRVALEQIGAPTREQVLGRLQARLSGLQRHQLQIVEIVVAAIARGAA